MDAQELYDWVQIGNKSIHEAAIHFNIEIKDAQKMYSKIHYERD